ncbi:MAG: hypothetical protein FWG91_04645 [Lachnospiraceae bacterium]|nr:hypothetical protein [Lachnospiraceae bacterium]
MSLVFTECIDILKNYVGDGYLFFVYLAAVIYLLFAEKEKRLRLFFIYAPMTILLVFLFPVTRWLYVKVLDEETYYRFLWLLPLGVTIAYSGCKIWISLKKPVYRYLSLFILVIVIVLSGKYVYENPNITRAENFHNLPGATINVCDFILDDAEFDFIYAVFPKEHVHFVRQYSSEIKLAYGRDILVDRWGFFDPVHDIMENHDIIDIASLLEITRPKLINYLVIHWTRATCDNPENYGLLLLDQVDGLLIYRDEVVANEIRATIGPYYPKRW